jgi:predicted ATPase/DNA-binding CsgD family transcriptional regulator
MGVHDEVSARGSSIPRAITSLVGREADIAAIERLTATNRLVTLTGTGGVGKTRVAAHVASAALASGIGVHWVDVAPCSSADILQSTIASRIGANDFPERPWRVATASALADRPALLVLDNCEHLLDAVAVLVAEMIETVPNLSAMLTSREPLGIAGETVYRVPSLHVAASWEPDDRSPESASSVLFLQRAREAWSDLVVDDAMRAVVHAICVRLDGIPLAIELAAARTRHMSPEAILDGLQDRFRLLTGGSRTALARHRTMRMSMEWSYQLLDESERCALRVLSVFRDRFTIDASRALLASVCGSDPAAADDALGRLVDKSMVAFDGERYRLLDTVRAYATELADSSELVASRDAHAEWCAQWLSTFLPRTEQSVIDAEILAGEHDIIAALEWSRDAPIRSSVIVSRLGGFWYRHSRVSDTIAYGLGTLESVRPLDPVRWARTACSISFACVAAGCTDFLEVELPQAVALAERAGYDVEATFGYLALAFHRQAWADGAAALASAQRTGHPSLIRRSAAQLCIIGLATADPSTASDAMAALDEKRMTRDAADDQMILISRAYWDYTHGRLDAAGARFAELLTIREIDPTIELTSGIGACLIGLLSGDAQLAERGLRSASAVADRRGQPALAEALAWVIDRQGASPATDAMLLPFVAIWRTVGGLALVEVGRTDDARRLVEAPPTDASEGSFLDVAQSALNASVAQLAEVDEPDSRWHRVLQVAAEHGYPMLAVDAFEALAARSTATPRVARRLLDAAHLLRQETGYRHRFRFQQEWVDQALAATTALTVGADADVDWRAVAAWANRGRGERHRPSLGWGSLTRTERSVVELVALGLTNPEIAERLLMSRATVKTHLAHVFSKAGVRSRTELATTWNRRNAG